MEELFANSFVQSLIDPNLVQSTKMKCRERKLAFRRRAIFCTSTKFLSQQHSLVTRCLCERLRLDALCQMQYDRLGPTSPNQDQSAWNEWRDAHLISLLTI
ncbi:unnamed protein product, partial [Strongylus vulgaris]